MRKLRIPILIAMILVFVLLVIWVFTKDIDEEPIKVETNEPVEEIALPSELRIKSPSSDVTYTLSDEEVNHYLENHLIHLDYLKPLPRFIYQYDESTNELMMVYEDQTYRFDLNASTYTLNNGLEQDNHMILQKAGTLYVNLDVLQEILSFESMVIEEPLLSIQLEFIMGTEASNPTVLAIEKIKASHPEKINMTWEAVYSAPTKIENLYEMPGLNIISPVWYDLTDGTGTIKSKKQDDYMVWADSMGYILWPAITNGFDPDMTRTLISSIEYRTAYINKLVVLYSDNGFEGINIDFENIYKQDKDLLSQFIAELTAAFHRAGIIVSMDVTFAGGSDNWSLCYDRKVLGEWVDYIVVMSYDQHWGSSPVSGTVAGIDWLSYNLEALINEVESDKIIMGIPFYMRVWFERPSKEVVNEMKVTSDAITMHAIENILEGKEDLVLWDAKTGQKYISYIDAKDNALKKIWIEDEESLRLKIELIHKYKLKGVASWRRGYELKSVWPMIDEVLREGS